MESNKKCGNAKLLAGYLKKINGILNSNTGQQAINNLIGAIYLAGDTQQEKFIDFCVTAWPMVSAFIWAALPH